MTLAASRKLLAGLVVTALLVPSALMMAPPRAHAFLGAGDIVHDPLNGIILLAQKALDLVTSSGIQALVVKGYVLDPIVRALAQAALKSLTGSIINFVNGKGSGGSPLFIRNLSAYLLNIGDKTALSFFAEITKSSNSPFAGVIESALRTNYLQNTSAGGFWAANICTLGKTTPDINTFFNQFSQGGGLSTWFQLTTTPNDPYMFYYIAKNELNSRVAQNTANAKTQANQGNGFISFCDTSNTTAIQAADQANANSTGISLVQVSPERSVQEVTGGCTNADGTQGVTKTPGSVIHDKLSQAVGTGIDSLVSAHTIDEMVSAVFVNLLTNVLGGNGLFGASQSTGNSRTLIDQLQHDTSATPGAVTAPVLGGSGGGGGGAPGTGASQILSALTNDQSQVQSYATSWQTIGSLASGAQSAVNALVACEQSKNIGDPYGAQTALTNIVTPAVTGASSAATIAANAQAAITRISGEVTTSSSVDSLAAASADFQAFVSSPPSSTDISNAQSNAQLTGGATAPSSTSLNVSGGTTADQLQLITTNAGAAVTACQAGTTTP